MTPDEFARMEELIETLTNELGSLHQKDRCHGDTFRCHTHAVIRKAHEFLEGEKEKVVSQLRGILRSKEKA